MADQRDVPDQQRTVTSQLEALRQAGFDADFDVMGTELVVRGMGPVDPRGVHIDAQFRFEGASDPDDESLVMGVHDPASGVKGVLVSAYGPSASRAEAEILSVLATNPSCASPTRSS